MRAAIAVCLCLISAPAWSQGWGDLDSLLLRSLSPTGAMEAAFWLPDNPDPTQATRALGVVYAYIPGSAGNTSIHVGRFMRSGSGFVLAGPVTGLFGHDPRDQAFFPGRVEITTTTLGPNEPRCCPTVPQRWSVDLATGQARPVN